MSLEALLSAVLLILAAPPFDLHVLVWAAWVPLLRAVDRAPDGRAAALRGGIFGALYYAFLFRWMVRLPALAMIGSVAAGILYGACFAAAARRLRHWPDWARVVIIPLLWIAPVLVADNPLRPFWDSVILLAGVHSFLPTPFLLLARPAGEVGLIFFVLLVNALLWTAFESRRRPLRALTAAGCAAALLAAAWGLGQARSAAAAKPAGRGFKLACAQHDLPFAWTWRAGHQEEIFRTYEAMALEAAGRGAGMVMFPQYQIPEDIARRPERWGALARKAKVYLALGTYTPADPRVFGKESRLVCLVFSPEGKLVGEHQALHPSPLGRPMVLAGTRAEPIEIAPLGRLAFLPCYDDVTPRPARLLGRAKPELLAAIANDGLFAGTVQPALHLLRSRLRAAESGAGLLRCTPNGISAVIDSAGGVRRTLPGGRGLLFDEAKAKDAEEGRK